MKIRYLFLASSLTLAFGCPGDDSGDDSNTSANASSTGQDMQTTGEHESSGGHGSSSGGGESSSGGGGESSSSGGGGESSSCGDSTGGAAVTCESFCADYFTYCGEEPSNDYGDHAGCEKTCGGWDAAGFECRVTHLGYVVEGMPAGTHCPHANADGGGQC
jgi:hypothetical protein